MADAVDLVRAYLQVNGYFTVVEYPVLEQLRGDKPRMLTDLDMLAFRFPRAGPVGAHARGLRPALLEPDPLLSTSADESDMIVAEIKEGSAKLNPAARDPRVLELALVRFGCCDAGEAERIVQRLLHRGEVRVAHGHRIRLMAFGATRRGGGGGRKPLTISLGHVVAFLREHLRAHWDVVRHAQVTDPALGFLALLEKATRGEER